MTTAHHPDHPNQLDLLGRPCGPIGAAQRGLFASQPEPTAPTPAPTPAELDTLQLDYPQQQNKDNAGRV